jgi:hypothetical protein
MKHWEIRIFGNKYSDVDTWIEHLPPPARARMDLIIDHLGITIDWTKTGYFRPLIGYKKISEIIFTVQNIQYRPLGCYGPGSKHDTILVGATKTDRTKFHPLNAPIIALK